LISSRVREGNECTHSSICPALSRKLAGDQSSNFCEYSRNGGLAACRDIRKNALDGVAHLKAVFSLDRGRLAALDLANHLHPPQIIRAPRDDGRSERHAKDPHAASESDFGDRRHQARRYLTLGITR